MANFVDSCEHGLKNIARPLRVHRLERDGEDTTQPAPDLAEKPSIAVLPFQNMSGDAEQDYFCDGLVGDIITTLSKLAGLRECIDHVVVLGERHLRHVLLSFICH